MSSAMAEAMLLCVDASRSQMLQAAALLACAAFAETPRVTH